FPAAYMRRYLSLYLPDCAFEILGTNRYTITIYEAMVVSRKLIRKGEEIKYLCGIRVILTGEEEDDLKEKGLDFSIIKTTRNNATSLLSGPVRFSNHNCEADARLVTTGSTGMKVVATRDIRIGEEITVTYSGDYFGEENCECLCQTCE
ncbi:SET domain-containing protein, partial [Hyaloscypha bicolor E]